MLVPPSPTAGPRAQGAGGVEIATWHYGGDGPPLLLAHATGFHGRCWIPFAAALADRFDVWAVDHRAHGASGKAPDGRYDDWSLFVDDLVAVVDTLGLSGCRAFGHSLGGAVLLLAEARRPGTFAGICCFEPVVVPAEMLSGEAPSERPRLNEVARKRRASFASKRAAWENYSSKPPFSRFDPEALAAYVEFGFVKQAAGTVTLACAPRDEASVYEGAVSNGAWDALPSVRPPVTVLGGEDADQPVSMVVEGVARRLPRGAALRVAGVDHFGPFEEPAKVAEIAGEALGAGRGVHHGRHNP